MFIGFVVFNVGIGVDQVGDDFFNFNMGMNFVDFDLLAIIGGVEVNDLVWYIIIFILILDIFCFNYIFGFEEYLEYVCFNFNDVFGFFISGLGINGLFFNNVENIVFLFGIDLLVMINNFNFGIVGLNGSIGNCMFLEGSLDYFEFYNDNDNFNN